MRAAAALFLVSALLGLLYGLLPVEPWPLLSCWEDRAFEFRSIIARHSAHKIIAGSAEQTEDYVQEKFGLPSLRDKTSSPGSVKAGGGGESEVWIYDLEYAGVVQSFSEGRCVSQWYLDYFELRTLSERCSAWLTDWCLNRAFSEVAERIGSFDYDKRPIDWMQARNGEMMIQVGRYDKLRLWFESGVCRSAELTSTPRPCVASFG